MSIKSQKSLNDECSEIIERSYSVRSNSEESLSGDEEEDSLSRELLKKLTPAMLSKLRRCFKKTKEKNAVRDVERRIEEVMRAAAAEEGIEFSVPVPAPPAAPAALCLDEKGFVSALEQIFGHHKYSPHAHQLFQALDMFGSGRVWWRQVVGRLVAAGALTTSSRRERWEPMIQGQVKKLKHCKRETIVKLVSIEREDSFCYVAISRGGRVGVYSGEMNLINSYEIFYQRTGVHRRVKNCWITDAVYLNDVQSLVISASDRSLTIYDVMTLTHAPMFCVTGLPHIPTCLAYKPARDLGDESELVIGNERGDLTRIRFLQPRVSLLHTKSSDNINCYFWMELPSPPNSRYVTLSTWRRVHSRSVRRVCYERDGDIVLSCSLDSSISVRSRHTRGKLDDYIFKVPRGVSCFHVVSALHLIATGSPDGVVRLWECPQGSQFASLSVPGSPAIMDVIVVAASEIVVACCSNCNIHIWDLFEECLLQTVKIRFPFLGVLGKNVEFGPYCIHPVDPPRRTGPPRGPLEGLAGGDLELYEGDSYLESCESSPPCEVLVSCCDHVCSVLARRPPRPAPPPPRHALRARRPSAWDLSDHLMVSPRAVVHQPPPSPKLLIPVTPEPQLSRQNLDELLEKAGLQGILEKDFVLMRGLKHDLNKKLHEMETNMNSCQKALSIQVEEILAMREGSEKTFNNLKNLDKLNKRTLAEVTPNISTLKSPHTITDLFLRPSRVKTSSILFSNSSVTREQRGAVSQLALVSCSPAPPPRPDTHRFCPETSMNTPSGSEHSSFWNYKLKL